MAYCFGLQPITEETRRMGKMKYPKYVTARMAFLIVALWIFGAEATGLGGPALLALVILSMLLLWIIGFPEGMFEQPTPVLDTATG